MGKTYKDQRNRDYKEQGKEEAAEQRRRKEEGLDPDFSEKGHWLNHADNYDVSRPRANPANRKVRSRCKVKGRRSERHRLNEVDVEDQVSDQ